MRYLLSLSFFLISMIGLGQPTYLDLFIQFDQYPNETSWLITQGTDTVFTSPSYDFQQYVSNTIEERLFLESGVEYKFYMNDVFGDGICCEYGPGYFNLQNACDGIVVEDLEFAGSSVDYTFTLSPCTPPIITADVTFRVDLANAPPNIETPGVLGSWNGWQVIPMTLGGNGVWFVDVEVPVGNHLWKFADFNNPAIQELPAGVNESPCFQFDEFGFINRTLNIVEDGEIILPPYCWESCLPCGGIAGCTNFNAINWSPWANFDDGSCIVQNNDCPPGETIIEVVVTPDNFGGETSWKLFNDFGEVAAVNPGEYGGSPPGIPISTFLCVPVGVQYDLVIFDTYGDGLCGSCFGGNITGNVQIFDCEGTELYNLQEEHPDGNFGYDTLSPQFEPTQCDSTSVVEGCLDPNYLEYNPDANIPSPDDCITPVIIGCTDETQYNWNPEANTQGIIESCEFNLTIKDGVGDGWFGSWLGIWQFGYNSPQYQMGPDDGTELSFNLELDATQPAYVYFFVTPQSIGTAQQCGFKLTNSEGEVMLDVPFFNIIPFLNESGWYRYEIDLDCGNTCIPFIDGCQNPTAINYNDEANFDDGSCYFEPGCTQAGYLEYYTQGFEADFDNGDCQTLAVFGCTDQDAFNYDEEANVDNEGCIPKIFGCTNPLAFNYDENANTPDGSCIAVQEGCTDPSAFNYEENANTDDGSCVEVIFGCTLDGSFNFDPLANTDNGSCIPKVLGCMDDTALNFNPDANIEDGSCITAIYGCTDSTAFNYNELANVDNESCIEVIEGCMDPLALNFDPLANVNNFECTIPEYGCTDSTALNFNELANVDNGTCIQVVEGCTNPEALNFDESANVDDFSCILPIYGCTDPTSFNFNELANTDNGTCIETILGCTNSNALNFNIDANVDDESCILPIYGCTDSSSLNYNELANVDNGTCIEIVEGCTNPEALNFDPLSNTDDLSCILPIYGCTDPTALNFNELANVDNGTCTPVILGCTNPSALNYNVDANTDDLSCILPVFGCTDPTALNFNETANTDNGTCIEIVEGCTNPEALNYDENANVDDFSCILPIYGCTDPTAFNYNELANIDNNTCEEVVEGCTDPEALNYNELANVDDFSCILPIYGCTDSTAFNYNELATVDNGTCIEIVEGCTDPSAFNYNPEANTEDFSCEPFIYGCTDPQAANYDEEANTDNGTCETVYQGCVDQTVESYNLLDPVNAQCFAWVLDVSPDCCDNEWNTGCQSLYEYCFENGETTNVNEILNQQIIVYPNPTLDIINFSSQINFTTSLFNSMGQKIIDLNNPQLLDMSEYESGVYQLIIDVNGNQFSKKIIKQ